MAVGLALVATALAGLTPAKETRMVWFWIALAMALVPRVAWAEGSLVDIVSGSPWLGAIPLLVPALVWLAKLLIPKVPKWLLPILCPLLGGAADAIMAYLSGTATSPVFAAVGGAVGLWLREVVDQLKKSKAGG